MADHDTLAWLVALVIGVTVVYAWAFHRVCERLEKLEKHGDTCMAPDGWTFNPPINPTENPRIIWRKHG